MKAKILNDDGIGRYKAGDMGTVIKHDAFHYSFLVRLERMDLDGDPVTLWFGADQIEQIDDGIPLGASINHNPFGGMIPSFDDEVVVDPEDLRADMREDSAKKVVTWEEFDDSDTFVEWQIKHPYFKIVNMKPLPVHDTWRMIVVYELELTV